MAESNKELTYKVKFEADEQSAKQVGQDLQNQLDSSKKSEGGSKERTKNADKEKSVLKELREELKQKREELATLNELSRKSTSQSNTLRDAQRELGASIQEVAQRIQEANKGYTDQESILASTPSTYSQLVEQNRALSIAMRNVPLDDTTGKLKSLQAQYEANNNKLKAFDATIGNHQRNVGDYENSIRSVANTLAIFQGPLGPIAGRINALATVVARSSKANTATAKTWAEMNGLQRTYSVITFQSTIPTIKAATNATRAKTVAIMTANGAIKGLNATLFILRKALIATGIGAFVVALGSVVAFFNRSEEGAEALRVRLAGLRAQVDVILDRFANLGKIIVEAFENPKQAVSDLWEAIKTNLMNRVVGIGDTFKALGRVISSSLRLDMDGAREASVDLANSFAQALTGVEDVVDKIKDGVGGIADEMRNNKKEATDLENRMNAVLRTERALGVERSKQNRDLQEARDLARDLTIDYDERLAALQAVRKSELSLMQQEIDNEKERLDILEQQAALSLSDAATNQGIADQKSKLFELEQKHLERSISLRRDETAIIRQRDEFALRTLRNEITQQERASNLAIRRVEREMIMRGQAVELALLEQQSFQERLEQERNARFLAYQQEYLNQRFSAEDANRMARLRADEELELELIQLKERTDQARLERERATAEAALIVRNTVANREFENDIAIARLKNDQVAIIEAERAMMQVRQAQERDIRIQQMADQFASQGIERHQAVADAKLIIDEQYAQESEALERNLAKAKFAVQQENLNALINLTKNTASAIFGENRAVAAAGAIMDTYSGATAALAMRPWTPLNYVNAGAVIAAGIANVRKILAVKKDTQTVSATQPQAPTASEQFQLIDTENFNAMSVAGESSSSSAQPELTVILDGEFDKEALAVKVREGNNALSSRGVIIRTGL